MDGPIDKVTYRADFQLSVVSIKKIKGNTQGLFSK